MRRKILYLAGLLIFLMGCNKDTVVPIPSPGSDFMKDAYPLEQNSRLLMEGVYRVTSGSDKFGEYMVVKWTRTTLLLANNNGKHFIMNVGYLDSVVFLQGYWRDGYSDATGLCNMYVSKSEGGTTIVTGNGSQQIIIRGAYGKSGNDLPDQTFTLEYLRPFSDKVKNSNYYILAHRCGGRNSDRLPVSENSIAMVRFTEQLGTTGIEMDPRVTTDGVPFVYHDSDINTRLTQKGPLAGDVAAYSWYELSNFVTLIHGEKIPTVEEVLTFAIDSTNLRFVYLDMKSADAVAPLIPIQLAAIQRAKDKGRDILIVMGIPTTDVLNAVLAYPDHQNLPTLCELTVDDVREANSKVWAPRWTLGTQNDLVQQMHDEGRLAVCWTVDNPSWIQNYIETGHFDGLLTNYPYVEAYYHYIQE
jgi:glycerophosphoryl diester phosphodiesterase